MSSEIGHFEIPAKNTAKLSKFYSSVFGWSFKDSGMQGMEYWLIRTGPKTKDGFLSAGGMYKKTSTAQKPVNYVMTDNIDASLRKFKSAGGKVTQPKVPVGQMGWSAKGLDPEGNQIALFQAKPMPAPKKSKK